MATFSAEHLDALRNLSKKSSFVRKTWKVDDEYTATLKEYGEFVNPLFKNVSKEPKIIEKPKDKGTKTFLKALFTLDDGTEVEFDLSYEHSFHKGDFIDLEDMKFCVEKFHDEAHLFVTGSVL